MMVDLRQLSAFIAVAQHGGFRKAARAGGMPAATLSASMARLEANLGMRLINRTTRTVTLTEAGQRLLERLKPALGEVHAALDVVNGLRASPAGTLRLNVPVTVAKLVLPQIANAFLKAYPNISLDVVVNDAFVNILEEGADAGIRYGERLEQDMIAVPIGPRRQRFATAASPDYLEARGVPTHPRHLLSHDCLRHRFSGGAMPPWEFERDGETVVIDAAGRLIVSAGSSDIAISAAIAGLGIVSHFEDWLRPAFRAGDLVPVLEDWWESFPGPFLYYPSRRYMPTPLRAFVDFLARHPRRGDA